MWRLTLLTFLTLAQLIWALEFTRHTQTVEVTPDQSTIHVDYAFSNPTKHKIDIAKIDAPCTCLSATLLDKEKLANKSTSIKPGAKGYVRATLDIGNFKGQLNKKLIVWTNEKGAPPQVLNLNVKVPSLVTAIPKSLSWKKNVKASQKEFSIIVSDSKPYKIISHKASNKNFKYQLTTEKEGYAYKLTVTPTNTKTPCFAAIELTTDSTEPRYQKIHCYLSIKP
ncbi:DUF1573 domain-containing protein [Rubritalea tangerina]|uniref:DUF1573 domain-containing protein n=1 Tax=Rubritalea tangerina TaxID=430798 RepID=A0ABW4ZDH7_9BACT